MSNLISVPRELLRRLLEAVTHDIATPSEVKELRAILAQPAEQHQHQGEPVAWGAFYFGGKRHGQLYNHCQTEEEIDRYIQQVERSNDSISLVKDRLYTRPAEQPAPIAVVLSSADDLCSIITKATRNADLMPGRTGGS